MRTIEEIKAEYQAELDKAVETGKQDKARALRAELVNILTKGISTERIEKICNAERDGRCWTAPCKPGERWSGEQGDITVKRIITDSEGTYVFYRYIGKRYVYCCNPIYFAEHFARPEEAEAALNAKETDEKSEKIISYNIEK